ncbi:hypothetical protein IPA_01755 [Ignicoccus pacificus DSM 13166]|uniref:DUF72 domain-containing protein n=1 Tax=Ignicoccus pacificus DSM 13166 TaxID=940294 RepID=A0A977PJU3_9CREN|nr:hypothetical protein IPA_01755 [Ignicoccus pacificus DSM 13166]
MTKLEVYVGTSGWSYDWNPDGLEWYAKNSGLNAVELNASFYRFPFKNMIRSWSKKGRGLRWAVKVHRSITHVHRLNERSYQAMEKFLKLFEPMRELIDFYLVQLPPTFLRKKDNEERVEKFCKRFNVPLAFEFRHENWYNTPFLLDLPNYYLVSIDSPIGTWIIESKDVIYLRLHGRRFWYAHEYSEEELEELAKAILRQGPKKIYAFFNNDHWMLENARLFMRMLKEYAI